MKMIEEIPHPKYATIYYCIHGIKFHTMSEVISIMKNDLTKYNDNWLSFFEIALNSSWEEQYMKFIPHYTEKELMDEINSTSTMTESEMRERYQGDQLIVALSYINDEYELSDLKCSNNNHGLQIIFNY